MPSFTFRRALGGTEPWRRNLYVLALAMCVIIAAFDMSYPFLPLFVRDLGVEDPGHAALWSSVINAGSNVALFIAGPIWGWFADRYGRKANVLRATMGAAVLTALTALSMNVFQLAAFRIAGGLATGVFASMLALAASNAPPGRAGYSIGIMQMALFTGSTMGPVMGGILAEAFGYRAAFVAAGVMLAAMGSVIWLWVSEDFRRAPEDSGGLNPLAAFREVGQLVAMPGFRGIYALQALAQLAPIITYPVVPVFLQELSAGGSGASAAGFAFGEMGLAAALSSFAFARVSQRIAPIKVVVAASLWAVLFNLLALGATATWHVLAIAPFMGLAEGAVTSAAGALIAEAAAGGRQGRAFGAMQSVNSLAWGLGPLMGGATAARFGLRWAFLTCAATFAVAACVAWFAMPGRRDPRSSPPSGAPPA